MKKKVVYIYGVGFHNETSKHHKFLDEIKEKANVETEDFRWTHGKEIPNQKLPYSNARDFFCEVVYDFQHVVKYADTIQVPEADLYIGHSAGSIICLMQNKPCVLYGSPAILVESVVDNFSVMDKIYKNKCNILNIINEFDLLSYELPYNDIVNERYKGSWWNPSTYNPLWAHLNYFESKYVINRTVEFIKDSI
jgi:hypothetical protein